MIQTFLLVLVLVSGEKGVAAFYDSQVDCEAVRTSIITSHPNRAEIKASACVPVTVTVPAV